MKRNLTPSINAINKLSNISDADLTIPSIVEHKRVHLKKTTKGFKLEINDAHGIRLNRDPYQPCPLNADGQDYVAERVYINLHSGNYSEGIIDVLYSDGFDKEALNYYRLFIKVESEIQLRWYFQTARYGAIPINLNNLQFEFTQVKDKHEVYFVIEVRERLPYEEFTNYCFSILISFGFITGRFAQTECFVMTYKTAKMYQVDNIHYTTLRDSIRSHYQPIYTNAHSYLDDSEMCQEINKTLTVISLAEFSMLCQRVYENEQLNAILVLLLEASVSSLLYMPSGYMVVLEALKKVIAQQESGKIYPIADSNKAKRLIQELEKVLDEFDGDNPDGNFMKVRNRIRNINQPLNTERLPNIDELTRPFEQLGIELNEQDMRVIERRNDFLHGNIFLDDGEGEVPHEATNKKLLYTSWKLHWLISALILKWVGYHGRIVNYAKINEDYTGVPLNEDHFRMN